MSATPLLLVGAGGHATSCIDVVERGRQYVVAGLVASTQEVGQSVLGYPVLCTDEGLPALLGRIASALVAVGQIKSPEPRIRLFERLRSLGFQTPAIVSPACRMCRQPTSLDLAKAFRPRSVSLRRRAFRQPRLPGCAKPAPRA